jgi:ELAV like protein 2/3/4
MDKSNLIVNYLPSSFTEDDLLRIFQPFGPIESIKIVRDKVSGISMGFGFVNFHTNLSASAASLKLTGHKLAEGKRMNVSVARPAWKANIHSNL